MTLMKGTMAGLVALVTLLAVVTWCLGDWTIRAQFGDSFGSLNAILSGFAFAALIYTIHLQRDELALQREELKLQREEMAKSATELAAQSRIQRAQFHASIAQIRVVAKQMEVEAQKMESEGRAPGGRAPYELAIRNVAEEVVAQADALSQHAI